MSTAGISQPFQANPVSHVEYKSVDFSRLQVEISERKGYSLARQGRFEEGYLAIDNITDCDQIVHENLSARITRIKMFLLEIHQLLGSDPLLCVLSESGISSWFGANSSYIYPECLW